jgi:2-dehydropantoate 2-reductase
MKVLIVGAGAVGAYIGALLARAGQDVTMFARGPHCRAMQQNGVRVQGEGEDFVVTPRVIDNLNDAGPVDAVFLTVKAHHLTDLAPKLRTLGHPETVFVSTQNGIPWWYFQRHGGEWDGMHLESVDPGRVIGSSLSPERVIGGIIYFSTEVSSPGVVRHIEGNRIPLGELDGARTDRSRAVAEALIAGGFRAPISTRIRHEIWTKILGNMTFNPISVLTRATVGRMATDPDVSGLARNIMAEAQTLAERVGVELPVTIEQRIAGAARVGEHKTSMLQDLEAGRPLELDPIVGAVLELGDRCGVPMPHTRTVYSCAKLLERVSRGASA